MAVAEALKSLKGDLSVRFLFHRLKDRIEVHIFIPFLSYCLNVTLGNRLKHPAPGLTTRSVLVQFSAGPMIDVCIKLTLPAQSPPKISAAQTATPTPCSTDFRVCVPGEINALPLPLSSRYRANPRPRAVAASDHTHTGHRLSPIAPRPALLARAPYTYGRRIGHS
ncbi:MAG: hypothetical protein ACYCT1_10705 [Steroidobacteraceae bacterium]